MHQLHMICTFATSIIYNVRCIKPGPRILLRRPAICIVNIIENKYLSIEQQLLFSGLDEKIYKNSWQTIEVHIRMVRFSNR
jgi:hypothetical protein